MTGAETVTRLRPTQAGVDRNENPVYADVEFPIFSAWVAGNTSQEPGEYGRSQVITGITLYLPPGTDVRPSDRFRVRGQVYEVEGLPFDWDASRPHLYGEAGVQVSLRGSAG